MGIALILFFIFGTIIGSFLNVLIFRLPQEKSINGRSYCRSCNHKLDIGDLVPVFSFLLLNGRCRYCQERVSWQYVSVEVITGLFFSAAYYMVFKGFVDLPFALGGLAGIGWLQIIIFLRIIFIISVLVVVFTIDLKHFLILDKVVYPATVVLFLINVVVDLLAKTSLLSSTAVLGLLSGLGVFLFFGSIYYFSRGRWLGFGDVKFAWFLGLAVPFPLIFVNVFLAFMIGAVVGTFLLIMKARKLTSKIAFGTFLSISCVVTIFFGEQILNWYLHLIGVN
ncbi:MAG: prepilin peptidase [Patescibacteria group bacterium]